MTNGGLPEGSPQFALRPKQPIRSGPGLYTELVYGTVRMQKNLDYIYLSSAGGPPWKKCPG